MENTNILERTVIFEKETAVKHSKLHNDLMSKGFTHLHTTHSRPDETEFSTGRSVYHRIKDGRVDHIVLHHAPGDTSIDPKIHRVIHRQESGMHPNMFNINEDYLFDEVSPEQKQKIRDKLAKLAVQDVKQRKMIAKKMHKKADSNLKTFKSFSTEEKIYKIVSNSPNKHSVHRVVDGRTKANHVGIFTTRGGAEREIERRGGKLHEDGAPAAAPAGTGAAPTNTTAGLASEKNPPMPKKRQLSYREKNAEYQHKGVSLAGMRKTLGGVNV